VHGLQVMVRTREHPPAHIHVDFLSSDKIVRLGWPSASSMTQPTVRLFSLDSNELEVAGGGLETS
jgi:hypothetical protein